MVTVAEKAHAILGASSSSRWINCPGSIPLSEGLERPSSFYAAQGSVAHGLAEGVLQGQLDLTEVTDRTIEHEGHKIIVDDEMFAGVTAYIEAMKPYIDKADWYAFEQKVRIVSAPEGAECFGTADTIAVEGDTLTVGDFKYGKGVPVGVDWNTQLMYYAIASYETLLRVPGVGLKMTAMDRIAKVVMVVVQPRIEGGHEPKTWEIDLIDLLMWRDEILLPAIQRVMDGDETREEGYWCRFCPAIAVCPTKFERAQAAAKMQFDDWHEEPTSTRVDNRNSAALTNAELGERLALALSVAAWANALKKQVTGLLRMGEEVPGWKLVEGRANRSWANQQEALAKIMLRSRLPADDMVKTELRSPNQIEILLKKAKKNHKAILDGLVVKPPGRPTLVPEHDKRPALTSVDAVGEFDEWTDDEEP